MRNRKSREWVKLFNCGSDIEYLDIITINEANLPKVSSPENTNSKYFRVCRACGAKIYFEDIEDIKQLVLNAMTPI